MKSQKMKGLRVGGGPFGARGAFGSPASILSYLAKPPDFSVISDSNVVVLFKNLLKKDSTTKTKALEELVAYAADHPFDRDGGVEEGVLDVWIEMYPRASIDSSRRVRELSHTFQFELMRSARKRMERHMPKIVGSWLAGLYDRDRGVSRAANDGLSSFLNTPEKSAQFWKKCQAHVLDFALSAIQETKDTLSDERSTTSEDAEAKHFRVVNAAISLLCSLLAKLKKEDVDRHQEKYDSFFDEPAVWKSVAFDDAQVRRATCQLMLICLDKRITILEGQLSRLKKEFVTRGLKNSQTGSATDFVKSLTGFTEAFPQAWTEKKKEKIEKADKTEKPLFSLLFTFLAAGSHGSAPQYWEAIETLLKRIPIPPSSIFDTVQNLRSGVETESRFHSNAAWTSYLHVCRHLIGSVIDESKVQFGTRFLRPLLTGWTDTRAVKDASRKPAVDLGVIQECYDICASDPTVTSVAADWICEMEASLSKRLLTSPTDQALAGDGGRWFELAGCVQKHKAQSDGEGSPVETAFDNPAVRLIKSCVDSISKYPQAVAPLSIIRRAIDSTGYLRSNSDFAREISSLVADVGKSRLEPVFLTGFQPHFVAFLQAFADVPELAEIYKKLWKIWAASLLQIQPSPEAWGAMAALMSTVSGATLAKADDDVKAYLFDQCRRSIRTETEDRDWSTFELLVKHGFFSNELLRLCLDLLKDNTPRALHGLAIISRHSSLLSDDDTVGEAHKAMLLLAESEDENISSKAQEVLFLLDRVEGKKPTSAILKENLEEVGPNSLSVNTLVGLALDCSEGPDAMPLADLLPRTTIWRECLTDILHCGINPSLSITSPLCGAQYLVEAGQHSAGKIARDRKGYSIPIRMAMYAAKMLEFRTEVGHLSGLIRDTLILVLATAQAASDQLTQMEMGTLFATMSSSNQLMTDEFVSSVRKWVKGLVDDFYDEGVFGELVEYMMEHSDRSYVGFYVAKALSELIQTITEAHGPRNFDNFLTKAMAASKANNPLPAAALLSGVGQVLEPTDQLNRVCNNLVSDVMGAKPVPAKALPSLVLLTSALSCYQDGEMPVQTNRLVFAVKNVTSWLEEEDGDELDPALAAEVCRLLLKILPRIRSVYGPHWEMTLEYCTKLWANARKKRLDIILPAIHASLKLYAVLESLEEPNDDLQDAIKRFMQPRGLGLIELLKLPRDRLASSQPLEIVDAIIGRQVQKLPLWLVTGHSDLYELMASGSRDIQTAAFSVLHKVIPAQQQQLSVDTLLDRKTAQLPDELLSLLLEHPTLEKYYEVLSQFPSPVRSYLLTWHLIFDAYREASLNIRNDYTENIKSDNYVTPLLEFMFDVLGHSAGNALKLDKEGLGEEQIQHYDIQLGESMTPEENMHWLLAHLFYLVLKYIPELFKAWFINCRSKQTKIAIEPWTSRYFSPLIISAALGDVAAWAEQQEAASTDEKELIVKVNWNAREVTAGYEVDEEVASITVKVPKGYPIEGIAVEGSNRAVASEKKWQNWLRATQGVITFSNGSIIDGLLTFRRNIVGALKGQSECAICYSIMSPDKRMPEKRCGTCKNLFHRTCLYKWLQTSNQNSCPLCRSPIDYIGRDTRRRPQI